MILTEAYYIGTSVHSYRSGEPAKIIDIKTCQPEGLSPRVCFHIIYGDGKEDWCPIEDRDNYKILTSEQVSKSYKVIKD